MRGSTASFFLLGWLISASAIVGHTQTTDPAPPAVTLVTLQASDLSIAEVAASLSAQSKTPVLAQPGMIGKFSGSFNKTPIETILGAVSTAAKVKWQKLYIPNSTAKADELVKARQQAMALDQLKASPSMVVFDPATSQQITFTRTEADPAQAALSAAQLNLRPVYLLYALETKPAPTPVVKAVTAPAVSRDAVGYADADMQQKQAFLNMSPDQRRQALEQSMYSDLRANETERIAYNKARRDAYNALRKSNPPVYQQWRQSMRGAWGNRDRQRNRAQGSNKSNGQNVQRNQTNRTPAR